MISELTFKNIKDTRNGVVKKMGNSAHIYLPKQWLGKEVIVLLPSDNDD